MSDWQDNTFRQTSERIDLEALRMRVAEKASLAGESGWWGCIEYFDKVETVAPPRVAELLNENVSGLTLAWPGGNLRADRTQDGFWVTEIELGKGDTPCKTRESQALVWGKAQGQDGDRTKFGEGRVKAFYLPGKVDERQSVYLKTTRVAVQDEATGAWHDHATILGRIESREGASA